MRIIDILNEKDVTLSFEVFPPKTEAGFLTVEQATEQIAALRPDFMSVTYGAGGGTSRQRKDLNFRPLIIGHFSQTVKVVPCDMH